MGKQMLINATQPEEARVAILSDNHLEEFDFETTTKKQLKGNIYLAKVIRIEPSLQAAFVEFGGTRHGFLSFNEIHPDYYRIPIEDREALLVQAREEISLEEEEVPLPDQKQDVEILGGEDVEELQVRPHRPPSLRQYKIQEVIKRRQIMLVQVVKEERGGKGAALTTYLSLAGRYCVLMPNAAKGGGISRKITNPSARKRLREVIESIEMPETMSLIIRTAGMSRSKVEIKRDSDYLMRLWNDIREKTLHSIAPCLIYEESNLIKRAIRDYYTRDIDEIWVEGETGYKEAREFIRKLMPSHLKKVRQYKEEKVPLFHRYGVEQQIDVMHNPVVQLKSGGYIVFGMTEALVAIDVNSGKATRERHIEETAFKTNLEAAEEVARQLRLRDLAGLVVIDFIDMDETRNIDAVERRLKDAMQNDRARVQVGRISPFGLLELSRQRLRPNIIESTSIPCQTCRGSGMIRSIESSALHVLRGIEEEALQEKASEILISLPTPIAFYILNNKREVLQKMETRWDLVIHFSRDDSFIPPDYHIERVRLKKKEKEASQKTTEEPTALSHSLPKPQHEVSKKSKSRGSRRPSQEKETKASHKTPVEEGNDQTKAGQPSQMKAEPSKSPTQSSRSESEKSSSSKPRRRYRKFNRRSQHPREETPPAPASQAKVSSQLPSAPEIKKGTEEPPSPPQKKAQKSEQQGSSPKEGLTQSTSSSDSKDQKKTGTRKGWWQRLLE